MEKSGKHIFGVAKIGEKGQIVIPKDARDLFGLVPGSGLMVCADENGIALIPQSTKCFEAMVSALGALGVKDNE